MRVLGIETSCDETGVAVYDGSEGLVAHRLFSQVGIHAEFGGVVPELASRDHVARLMPMIRDVLADAGGEGATGMPEADDLRAGTARIPVDGIAYTAGPGLAGALLVGSSVARSLSLAWGVPCLGVHHMEGHLLAPMLEAEPPPFPFVALLVSGGHSMLVDVAAPGVYDVLGESVDDAAGEAFDKTAKLLGLPYPGGPALAKLAEAGRPDRYEFPRPMTRKPGLDMSFSGLKTAVLLAVRDADDDEQTRADIARGFEDAVVETLVIKSRRALDQSGRDRLIVAGGVGANRRLRGALDVMARSSGRSVYYPRPAFCTDNGAMIAYAGYLRLAAGERDGGVIEARPRWSLETLAPV